MKPECRPWLVVAAICVIGLASMYAVARPFEPSGGRKPAQQIAKVQPRSALVPVPAEDVAPTPAPAPVVKQAPAAPVAVKPAPKPVAPRPVASSVTQASSGTQTKTALLVGISFAGGPDPLPGSPVDAKNMRAALLAYGFQTKNITMLLNGAATRPAILAALAELKARTASGGIAVIGISTHSGHTSFRTAEGARISKQELASAIGSIRARTWTLMAVCYAGEYAIPGITGPGRIATFSSPANERTWQLGSAGSYLVRAMVKDGMLEGGSPRSVESAFFYAQKTLKKTHPDRMPIMSDHLAGELVLGPARESAGL